MRIPVNRFPLRAHPRELAWPTAEWPVASPADDVDDVRLSRLLAEGFGTEPQRLEAADLENTERRDLERNFGLAITHRGQLVAERYGPTANESTTLVSWSMAKSIMHAVVGLLVLDGKLDLSAPAPVAEWANDERRHITIQQLLNMASGLEFVEDYVDDQASNVMEMLFGAGQEDVAGYARSLPLAHKPGSVSSYASGTSNILSAICGDIIGGGEAGMRSFLNTRLFGPLGMTSADPRFDSAGTFIASSYVYATAQDFLRFGYLYLRNGVWGGQQLLPADWAEHAREPVANFVGDENWYGAHWWLLDDDHGAFAAIGYEGQYIIVVPERDLVICRLGKTPADVAEPVRAWLRDIVSCFPADTRP